MRKIAAVLAFIPLALFAAGQTVTVSHSDGRTAQIDVPDRDTADLIVEFRDAPLFARTRIASASDTASAMKAFDARFAQFAADIRTSSPRITNTYERVFAGASVTVPRTAIAQIARLGYVKRVYSDATVHALDDEGVAKINANQVWTTFGTRGRGVVVAVIDTGIDYTHPALGGALGPNARVIGGFDFVNKTTDPMDDNGHGTHVAGIIGANSDTLTGVAPEVSFLAYKVLGSNGSGRDSDVLAAIERASDPDRNGDSSDHADVVNMSLGGGPADDPTVEAVENATGAGVVFCIAAGNSGGFFSVSAPAVAPSAIAVGATDLGDRIAPFSSAGPAGNSLILKPEVVAPGVDIESARAGGGTIVHSGTSMAAPFVAGVAALVKSLHRDWSPADIKSAIVTTAEDLGLDVMLQGGGRVDALRAAGTNVIASPPVLGLGRDQSSRKQWTATATIDLTNRSDQTLTLVATATDAAAGIKVAVDPQTTTLGPGETQTEIVTVDVDNSLLPFPEKGSLSLSGRIVFEGGASPIHVPWAFVKGLKVHATYDLDDPGVLIVSGAGGSKTFVHTDLAFGARAVDAYVPPGACDVELDTFAVDSRGLLIRYIFGDRRNVDADTTYAFQSSTAKEPTAISTKSPDGRALSDIGTHAGICYNNIFVTRPSESPFPWISWGVSSNSGQRLRFAMSTPPEGVSLTAAEACSDGASAMYIAQYGSITNADAKDGEIALDPSTWQHVPLRIVVPEGLVNPSILFGSTILTHATSILPPVPRLPIPVSGRAWTGALYITPELHPVVTTAGSLQLVADLPSMKAVPFVSAPPLRGKNDGIMLTTDAAAGPTTYTARSGELLTFGGGPVHAESIALVDQGLFYATVEWTGSLDDTRDADAASTTYALRDSSGAVLATVPPFFKLPEAGIYDLEMTRGGATLVSRVDSRLDDSAAPTLRSLRIVDEEGRQTPVVYRGRHATLQFAAVDLLFHPQDHLLTYALPKTDTATASWRPHGSTLWHALPLRVVTTDLGNDGAAGHPPAGAVFAADLSSAALNDGSIDLRLHVEDAAGNAIDYVLGDAFAVNEGRRRAITN